MKRRIRIGIDFDNTIICYDDLFALAAKEKGWNQRDLSKSSIRKNIIETDGNDFRWQELQAIVYGILIENAQPFPYVIETLEYLMKNSDIEIYVVSHKTKNSHYLKHITLIDKALLWIKKNNLFNYIPEKNFFFLPTHEEKIKTIIDLGLDFYIDDLHEVLEDKNFPPIHKLFFDPNGSDLNSWGKIKEHFEIINELGYSELGSIGLFARPPYSNMEEIKRDGNNKIFRFTDNSKKKFIIKKYSKLNNSFSTLEIEFNALELLHMNNFPVPASYYKNSVSGFAIYENVQTSQGTPHSKKIIHAFSQFLSKLFLLSLKEKDTKIPTARDSRFKIEDYKHHISKRLVQIEAGCALDEKFLPIQRYLNDIFYPLYKIVLDKYTLNLEKFNLDEKKIIPKKNRILSPSDFGMHNSIFNNNDKFIFIDFEYFGWDDPVKLIADFLHHPGQNITEEVRGKILKHFVKHASLDPDFFKRITTTLDLIGLEWILIILNIANPDVLKRRMHANPELKLLELIDQRLQWANEKATLFHDNIKSTSVFLSLKFINEQVMEIPAWQQLITKS